MNRYPALCSVFLCALIVAAGPRAEADIIYTNFGTGASYDTSSANPIGFDFFTGDHDAQGASFVPGTDSMLDSITIALSAFNGTNADPVTVAFQSDIAGVPANILETFVISPSALAPFGAANPPIALTSLLNPLMSPGTMYWVTVSASGSDPIAWNLNGTGAANLTATSVDGGTTWHNLGLTSGAFQVDGSATAVPEPSTLVLLTASALLMLAWGHKGTMLRGNGSGHHH